nr:acyl-CoA dehydrogenase family protein [Micromonospora sp. DSM 115978]
PSEDRIFGMLHVISQCSTGQVPEANRMTIDLTEERRAFVDAVEGFCRRECGTRAQRDELTSGGKVPHNDSLYRQMAELGWLGVSVSEEFGGAGLGAYDMCLFLETTARMMAPVGGFTTSVIVAGAYDKFGSDAQKKEVLGTIVNGGVAAIAMSEPGSGSDVASLTCKATKIDGGWVVNGQKVWTSDAHLSRWGLATVRTDPAAGKHDGVTTMVIDMT